MPASDVAQEHDAEALDEGRVEVVQLNRFEGDDVVDPGPGLKPGRDPLHDWGQRRLSRRRSEREKAFCC